MSQDNVEIVRRIFEAWAHGDFNAGARDLDKHVVFVVRADFPEFGVFVGPDGIRDFMGRFVEHWERLTIEARHLMAVEGTVVAEIVVHAKGRVSGIESDLRKTFMLFTFRGRKIVRLESVMHEAEALEAVGLTGRDVHAG